MAITSYQDISVVLSGGASNLIPDGALGGDPSSAPVQNDRLNNLFHDVSPEEATDGYDDYRCIYFFNDGDTTIYALKLYIYEDIAGGAEMSIGFDTRNEIQRITITPDTIASGTFTLSYDSVQFTVAYDEDLSVWAGNLQTALNSLIRDGENLLKDVTVTAQYSSGTVIFDINFTGRDAKRNHPMFVLVTNNLSGATDLNITTLQGGSPINTIAAQISEETTPPGGVAFSVPTENAPLTLPYLRPSEGFPLWIKRHITAGVTALERDGFTLRFSAESLE